MGDPPTQPHRQHQAKPTLPPLIGKESYFMPRTDFFWGVNCHQPTHYFLISHRSPGKGCRVKPQHQRTFGKPIARSYLEYLGGGRWWEADTEKCYVYLFSTSSLQLLLSTQGPAPPWQNAHQFQYSQSNLLHPLIYASVYEVVFFSFLPISFHREGAWSNASIYLHLCSFDF